ncbi:hypothetical protein Ddc_02829 [Ditylenchus destructor]|nr:hypothetical protein Ddc_02829 [Ditylenchus destructor]
MLFKILLIICVFYYIADSSDAVPIETSSEKPANVAECALKVTLKALNEFEAGNLSCDELCLLPIVTGLLQDQEQKITKSCSSLKRTLEQIRSCEDDPSKDILEDEVSKLVKWFCSKAGEKQSNELSLDEE